MKNTAIIPAVIASVFFLQCANPVTPTGGEKDVSAPKIVLTNPADKSTRTKPKTVLFKFDENIQTNNIKEQLIVSPAPVIKPKVSAGKNYVVVELADNKNFFTVEGNTSGGISDSVDRDGQGVYMKLRTLSSLGLWGGVVRLPY